MVPALLTLLLAATPGAPDGGVVTAKGHSFLAEVARSPQEQARGLMYRQSLARDRCMMFLYNEDGNHRIWMKNCLISLDVVWLKADGTVVEASENVPPCSPLLGDECPVYGGTVSARHFVEFPAGTLRRIGLKVGDRLGWKLTLDGQTVAGGAPSPAAPKKARKPKG